MSKLTMQRRCSYWKGRPGDDHLTASLIFIFRLYDLSCVIRGLAYNWGPFTGILKRCSKNINCHSFRSIFKEFLKKDDRFVQDMLLFFLWITKV